MSLLEDTPLTLVDIGARGGITPHWRKVKQLTLVDFEPDERAPSVPEPAHDWPARRIKLSTPLWNSAGVKDFYLTARQQATSPFKPNEELLEQLHAVS